MAESLIAEELPTEPYKLARYGITLLINNHASEAQELFKENSSTIQMSAGYSFSIFMDALMSFEEEKLQLALNVLRETEKKCATDIGWLKNVKTKMFGGKTINVGEKLENQIILADIQLCFAILTFLQQEFSGYLKGGWVLRKAWKIYQTTYVEIVDLYKREFGNFNLPEPTDFEWFDTTMSRSTSVSTTDDTEWSIPESSGRPSSPSPKRNGYVPIESPIRKPPPPPPHPHPPLPPSSFPHSQSMFVFTKGSSFFPFAIKRSDSAHSVATNNASVSNRFSLFSSQLSFLSSTLNLLASPDDNPPETISRETISRLMGAVCFGYGVLQLGISLLPPSLLKVTNFFGFRVNRSAGISNLMYARKGIDMRAPLAMLALLWYHTIVRPFFALDGNNVKAGLEAASLLMQESAEEYGQSALFLFFKGRIHRLNSNIPLALESFQMASDNSSQREIKLLAMHEAGWCHLLQLDYEQARKVFLKLKHGSRWSRAFYAFLNIICAGASVDAGGSVSRSPYPYIKNLLDIYAKSIPKQTQLDRYIHRRLAKFPHEEQSVQNTSMMHWKFYVFELIYLWNALPSCSYASLQIIIDDCNNTEDEPMTGLAMLVQGECYNIISNYENAICSFRSCILARSVVPPQDDVHVSAFAEYSLGAILIKSVQTREEGKALLQHCASHYKDYDFDTKLHVRIEMALKSMS